MRLLKKLVWKVRRYRYHRFLKSPKWFAFRAKHIKDHCEKCGSTQRLQLHHTTYKHGLMNPKYVITLCKKCHEKQHRR